MTLLFWGFMTGHPLIALPLIVLLELAYWTRLRWDFNDAAYVRAWQLSVLACGAMAVFTWIQGPRPDAFKLILIWLPVLLLPIQFTQSFGLSVSIPLNVFSFFARQRQLRNQRLGLPHSPYRINFGNIYLVSCLLGSTLGPEAKNYFLLPGFLIVIGIAILHSRQSRWLPLLAALILAGGIGLAGQNGISALYDQMIRMMGGDSEGDSNSLVNQTAIGKLGEVKLSHEIKWRLRLPDGGDAPKLMRTAGYNRYKGGTWRNERQRSKRGQGLPADADFGSVEASATDQSGSYYSLSQEAEKQRGALPHLPRFTLRGSVKSETQLPLPGNVAGLLDFELEGIDRNSLGTVRVTPSTSVIDGSVFWKSDLQSETPPDETSEFFVPELEEPVVQQIVDELKLTEQATVQDKIRVLTRFFRENFTYTRYLTIKPSRSQGPTAMSIFLTTNRRGHCEYFATAAALLLRQAKIPTRYAVGFIVAEMSPSGTEYVIRGEHGHAWCRVWDDRANTWIDFDPTPPGWLAVEPKGNAFSLWFNDWFLRLREDFTIWKNQPNNEMRIAIVMTSVGVIALLVVARRLWRSKHVVDDGKPEAKFHGPLTRTPLHDFENLAKSILGQRPPGMPFSRWLLGLKSVVDPAQLDEAIELHQRLRFDPAAAENPPVERLQSLVDEMTASLVK